MFLLECIYATHNGNVVPVHVHLCACTFVPYTVFGSVVYFRIRYFQVGTPTPEIVKLGKCSADNMKIFHTLFHVDKNDKILHEF